MKWLLVAVLLVLVAHGAEAWFTCKKGDYTCIDNSSFCQAGKRMRCPAGTRCKTPKKYHGAVQRSPCVTDTRGGDCPWGEFVCATKWTFCLGGQEMACAPGTVCNGFAPCEMPRRNKRAACTKPNYKCNGWASNSFCLKGEVMECPAGTFCLDWAPCVSYWSNKKRLA
ncbi:hypothetical protein COHA_007580 [Chlorella ohadii]|uniref:Uncharacterized protein n=1 Tax=Chlorella ohadii TaxID=2649997 RepID=A0AAD5GZS3_9CHLO|nr:hypothetical protein COHA_007580 [Chlorella ohadii]